jgi:putative ABC transport system permease protein
VLLYFTQILEQSCLFFPLVLGIYLSFSILKIADLSVDGSFVLGAAIFAKAMSAGATLTFAITAAIFSGLIAGMLTALVQRKNRIDPLIAGILMAFILNSLSLVVMERPNIGLLRANTIFEEFYGLCDLSAPFIRFVVLFIICVVITALLALLLRTKIGLWLKAFGNNAELVAMLGQNPEHYRMLGLMISNALAALCGCLTAQASGYADVNMGLGQALIGIAMILIGRQLMVLFGLRRLMSELFKLAFTWLGVILYFILTNELIRYGLSPVYLKMAIGGLLIIFLYFASEPAAHGHKEIS